MPFNQAEFLCSSPNVSSCPKEDKPEFCFMGRSNVGKSSLINALLGRKGLAKTSQTPGKTQLINHFIVDQSWYLVDLPGYGYAKVSKKKRVEFKKMMHDYLLKRKSLLNAFLLIDSRIPPQASDLEFIQFMGQSQLAFSIVFTKTDKLKPKQLEANLEQFKNELLKSWESLPPTFVTSSVKNEGIEDIQNYILEILEGPDLG